MASPLIWKVYNGDGEHIASTRDPEEAAALVGLRDDGRVRVDGRIVWREGQEEDRAGNSYDFAAGVMLQRRAEFHRAAQARWLNLQRAGVRR